MNFQNLKAGDEIAEVTDYYGRLSALISKVDRVTQRYVVIGNARYSRSDGSEVRKADWYDSTRRLMGMDDPALREIRIRNITRSAIAVIGKIEVDNGLDLDGCEELLSRIEATVRSARKRIADLSS